MRGIPRTLHLYNAAEFKAGRLVADVASTALTSCIVQVVSHSDMYAGISTYLWLLRWHVGLTRYEFREWIFKLSRRQLWTEDYLTSRGSFA